MTTLFKKHRNQIRKQAWTYSKKYNIEFDELEAQGYLIFCEALDRFDSNRGSFSTFLHHRLRTLNDFCRSEKRKGGVNIELFEDQLVYEDSEEEIFNESLDRLSDPAQRLLDLIKRGTFVNFSRKFGKCRLIGELKSMGWKHTLATRAVEEVESLIK
jgi:DNA-directed RNA polymerase specialized sigma24 family protein